MMYNIKEFGKVGVLMGGYSSEREISLKSGHAVYEALSKNINNVVLIDIKSKEDDEISSSIINANIDIAFIALHGKLGEDGEIQRILENLGILYTGSGVRANQLAINKIFSQEIFYKNNITIPKFMSIKKDKDFDIDRVVSSIGKFPVVVKPSAEGSSIGISVAYNYEELMAAIFLAFKYGNDVLIEEFIKGRELTVGIIEDDALPIIEIVSNRNFFDFTSKYQKGMTQYIVPADIPKAIEKKVKLVSIEAHKSLGCLDFSRVDIMLNERMMPYVLEVNTIPGFTSTSLLPKAANQIGINFDQLCLKLLGLAYGKKKKESYNIIKLS